MLSLIGKKEARVFGPGLSITIINPLIVIRVLLSLFRCG
ncbi:hypothetical protein NC99_01530 [Sunxiuqinia dokdonensis]|uniref:Uncharacterized protein n=1 Tax=Sunxiuqinia dokdonensis TaxID=1409788 RepID=A0A0L8VF86_9BACT|nr:hypothetical protein NC99_01530 [Sunxiuqinia dokdonensis]